MGKKKIEKTVRELNKLTGLNFQLDLSEIDDTDEAVIRLEQIVDSWKEKNSKNAYWRRLLTGELQEDEEETETFVLTLNSDKTALVGSPNGYEVKFYLQ